MTEDDKRRLAEIEARHELAQAAASDSCSLFMIEAIDDIPTLIAALKARKGAA